MTMYDKNNDFLPWSGAAIKGVLHPLDIEFLWTDAELRAIGLYRESMIVEPKVPVGKIAINRSIKTIKGVPTFSYDYVDSPAYSLPARKTAVKDAIKRHGDTILKSGFPYLFGAPYGLQHLQLRDETDRTNWLTSQAAYQAQVIAGNGSVMGAKFRTAENNTITLTFQEAYMVLLRMAAWGAELFNISWNKQDAVDSATTLEEINSLELTIEDDWNVSVN